MSNRASSRLSNKIKMVVPALCLLVSPLLRAQLPGYIPTNGLVGAWMFSGNANDVSPTGNNGTVFGATLVNDRCGNANSAYLFDGVNDYIQCLLTGPTGSVSRSVSFWVKTSNTQFGPFASLDWGFSTAIGDCYQFVWNYCALGVGLDMSNQACIKGNTCLLNNAWHHVVAVYNATQSTVYTTTDFYIDGVLQPGVLCNVSGVTQAVNTGVVNAITIGAGGCSGFPKSRFWPGTMDEILIYNRALSFAEVQQLYVTCPPPIMGSPAACNLSPTIYSVSPVSNSTYAWTIPPGWTGNSTNNTIVVTPAANAGVISVVISNTCGASTTSTLAVNVSASPTVQLTSNQPVCNGSTLQFTTQGASNYTLMGPNGYVSYLTNPSISNVPVTATGIYTLSGNNAGCTGSTSAFANVLTAPAFTASNSGPVCLPDPFSVSASPGATSYSWTGPNGFSGNQQNHNFATSQVTQSGIYTVSITAANGCRTGTTTMVNIYPPPSPTATGATVCPGQTAVLTGSGGINYWWNGPGGFSAQGQTVSITSPSAGMYTLTVVSVNNCTALATSQIVFNATPSPSANAVPARVCVNSKVSLLGSGGVNYQWKGPSGFSSFAQNAVVTAGNVSGSGLYTLTVTNGINCQASITVSITVDPLPWGDLTGKMSGCIPFCSDYNLLPKSVAPIDSISWVVNNQPVAGRGFNFCFTRPGKYPITAWLLDNRGCESLNLFEVTAHALPVADYQTSPAAPVEGIDEVRFTNTSKGLGPVTWSWYALNSGHYESHAGNISLVFDSAGVYPVALFMIDANGCSDTIVKTITVQEEENFYVPNAFTPDNDGLNDVFQPKGRGIQKFEMLIYDRWGEKIYSSNDPSKGWDGSFRGKDCMHGTYIWKISIITKKGGKKDLNGHVTLYR